MKTRVDAVRLRRVKEIFSVALDTPSSDRSRLIRERCEGDPEMLMEVEGLLALHAEDGLALDEDPPAGGSVAGFLDGGADRLGRQRREGEVLAGRYRIDRRIGGGGMGEVYAATDLETGQAVAVKTIRPFAGLQEQTGRRFLREVRMAQRINHPNVCRVLGLAMHEGERFCVMELLEGETLAERLRAGGRMGTADAMPVVKDLCAGLGAAHAAGVIHRDLKPGNVLLAPGSSRRAVIIDFGLAAGLAREHDHSLTADGEVIGTLAYMAPEQLTEGAATPASDVYSLGVLMYEMLTGQKPHGAGSPLRMAARKARAAADHLPVLSAVGVPPVWQEVIGKCLHPDRRERFQRAEEVAAALGRGRPSVGFVMLRRRVLLPLTAAILSVAGWVGWQWHRLDPAPEAGAGRLYDQAQAALAEAAPVRAVRLLEQAVGRDPSYVAARSLLAAGYAELDQPERAMQAMLEAAGAADQRWRLGRGERAGLRAARAAVVRDHAQAAAHYRQLADLLKGPSRTYALLAAARKTEQAGGRDEALRIAEAAVQGDPGNPAARVQHGLLLSLARQTERARQEFRVAEAALQRSGNLEGLSDLLLARAAAEASRAGAATRGDLEQVLALSEKTGNRYHNLTAKFRLAAVAETERDYARAERLAREAAEQARREGMPIVAAQALGELGYAFQFLKRPDVAAPILRESVEMAERAKATGTLATNRMRLGEVLGTLRRSDEALAVMEPAVAWMRQSGPRDTLPLTLLKWGTVLSSTPRFAEGELAFREALDLAASNGNEMYQSMALDRLGAFLHQREPDRAAAYWERALALARKTGLTRVFFLAARTEALLGRLGRAEELLREGEAEARKQPPGIDRTELTALGLSIRAQMAEARGDCSGTELRLREAMRLTPSRERDYHLARGGCTADRAVARRSLAWVEAELEKTPPPRGTLAGWSAAVARMHYRLGDWKGARERAAQGLEASREINATMFALDNALVLRAAERRLKNHAEAERLASICTGLARSAGFRPPERFGGRVDLLTWWDAGR